MVPQLLGLHLSEGYEASCCCPGLSFAESAMEKDSYSLDMAMAYVASLFGEWGEGYYPDCSGLLPSSVASTLKAAGGQSVMRKTNNIREKTREVLPQATQD